MLHLSPPQDLSYQVHRPRVRPLHTWGQSPDPRRTAVVCLSLRLHRVSDACPNILLGADNSLDPRHLATRSQASRSLSSQRPRIVLNVKVKRTTRSPTTVASLLKALRAPLRLTTTRSTSALLLPIELPAIAPHPQEFSSWCSLSSLEVYACIVLSSRLTLLALIVRHVKSRVNIAGLKESIA